MSTNSCLKNSHTNLDLQQTKTAQLMDSVRSDDHVGLQMALEKYLGSSTLQNSIPQNKQMTLSSFFANMSNGYEATEDTSDAKCSDKDVQFLQKHFIDSQVDVEGSNT